jgi:hypothetical protein
MFRCSAGELEAGESATFRLIIEPTTTGNLLFAAGTVADQPDPDPDNNAVDTTLTVAAKRSTSGGGGCAYSTGTPFDPTLPALLALAVLGLLRRRRAGR